MYGRKLKAGGSGYRPIPLCRVKRRCDWGYHVGFMPLGRRKWERKEVQKGSWEKIANNVQVLLSHRTWMKGRADSFLWLCKGSFYSSLQQTMEGLPSTQVRCLYPSEENLPLLLLCFTCCFVLVPWLSNFSKIIHFQYYLAVTIHTAGWYEYSSNLSSMSSDVCFGKFHSHTHDEASRNLRILLLQDWFI